jgi:putative transposase
VLLIDAIVIKVRDAQVANRPVYVAIGVNLDGERDVLGLWLGPTGGEGAKQWATMLTELRNRGVADALIVCCDGLKGLPDAIRTTWPDTRPCRPVSCTWCATRCATRRRSTGVRSPADAGDLHRPDRRGRRVEFDAFAEQVAPQVSGDDLSWENSWNEFVPFLEFPPSSARSSTRPTRSRASTPGSGKGVRHRGHFPNEQAAMKVLYLVATTRRTEPGEPHRPHRHGWKHILNTLTVHYGDRIAGRHQMSASRPLTQTI